MLFREVLGMLTVFKKNLRNFVICATIAFVFGAALYAEERGLWLSVGVFLGVSTAAFLFFEIKSFMLHNRFLYVLYIQLAPSDFLAGYSRLAEQEGVRKNVRFSMLCNICKAYEVIGKYEKALKVLDDLPKFRSKPEAAVIEASNRCLLLLDKGDIKGAKHQFDLFCAASEKGKLRKKFMTEHAVLSIRIRLAEGKLLEEDANVVRNSLKKSGITRLHMIETKYLLATVYEALGEKEFAYSYYSEMANSDSELKIQREAAVKAAFVKR